MSKWLLALLLVFTLNTSILAQDASNSGNLTVAAQTVPLDLDSFGSVAVQVTGTWSGTLNFEATVDGTNYFPLSMFSPNGNLAIFTNVNDSFVGVVSGYSRFRVRASVLSSGTAVVSVRASNTGGAPTTVFIGGTVPLPSGAATAALQTQPGVDIGDVTVNNAAGAAAVNIQDGGNSITVDGAVAATQSGNWNSRTQDGSGNAIASATAAPALGDRGLTVRNIFEDVTVTSGTVGNPSVATATLTDLRGISAVQVSIAVFFSSGFNVSFSGSHDGLNFSSVQCWLDSNTAGGTAWGSAFGPTSNGTMNITCPVAGLSQFRATTGGPVPVGSTVNITLRGSVGASRAQYTRTTINGGANNASVTAASTAAQTTDPALVVALSPNSPIPAGTANIGDVDVLTLPAVNQGTANTGANGWPIKIVDSSGNAVNYPSTTATTIGSGLAVRIIPSLESATGSLSANGSIFTGASQIFPQARRASTLILAVRNTGAFVGTLTARPTALSGLTVGPDLTGIDIATGARVTSFVPDKLYALNVAGLPNVGITVSAYVSGTVTVDYWLSENDLNSLIGVQAVNGTVAISGAIDTELAVAAALADNFANPTTAPVGAFNMVWDGATWDRWTGTVTALNLDVRDFAFATDKVDVSGSSVTATATDLDIRNMVFATDKVDVSGSNVSTLYTTSHGALTLAGTNVAMMGGRDNTLTAKAISVNASGELIVDPPDLTFSSDKVDTSGSNVNIVSSTLPTGAATEVTLSTVQLSTTSIANAVVTIGPNNAMIVAGYDGATHRQLKTDANGEAQVDVLTLPAVMTDRTQKTQLTDGTRDGTIKAASTAAVAADTAVVVALSPNSPPPLSAAVTANAPAAATVGVASASALAANANRKAAFFKNTSNATISCAESGSAAVLNSGITLEPGDAYAMVPPFVTTGQVNCIASVAASNLSILEKQ